MNTRKEEFLSALLDDESGTFERRRLLDELRQDDGLGQTLSRYALIGEVMRAKGTPAVANRDFLAGIHVQLEEEPEYHENVIQLAVPESQSGHKFRQPYLGYGMAAAVAVATVVGVMFLQKPTASTAEQVAVATPAASAAEPAPNLRTADISRIQPMGRRELDAETRDLLKQYVAQHVKYASTTAIVPSVRAVSYSHDY